MTFAPPSQSQPTDSRGPKEWVALAALIIAAFAAVVATVDLTIGSQLLCRAGVSIPICEEKDDRKNDDEKNKPTPSPDSSSPQNPTAEPSRAKNPAPNPPNNQTSSTTHGRAQPGWTTAITLPKNGGIDLDIAKGRLVSLNSTTADIGLDNSRYSEWALVRASGSLAVWRGGGSPNADECADTLAASRGTDIRIANGMIVCILTSSDNLAMARIAEQTSEGLLLDLAGW